MHNWLQSAAGQLTPVSEDARLEAQVLAGHVLHRPRSWVIAHPEYSLNADEETKLNGLLERLIRREPLPYLIGQAAFYDLDFWVDPGVLIPRPETELLVEEALHWLKAHPRRRLAVDVGCGSGCIAVTLAKHIPDLQVTAIDLSNAALTTALRNAERHEVQGQLNFVSGDLLSQTPGLYDLVCANLPYIPSKALEALAVRRYEPQLALDGGPDGLALIDRLLQQLPEHLSTGGLALLEIEAGQGSSAPEHAKRSLPGWQVDLLNDYAGLPRLLKLQAPTR